jgi:hypothetical protein
MVHPERPFTAQQQEQPGSTDKMMPRPDHGEHSYRGNGRLNGRVALITGADSGIGRPVAIAFSREGADVLVSYLWRPGQPARWRLPTCWPPTKEATYPVHCFQ